METFFAGQRVNWKYTHWLNSKSSTEIVKSGTCVRQMRDRKSGNIIHPDLVLVHFDGNKTLSKIKLSELEGAYLCDECKFTRDPHEHRCLDPDKCNCYRCAEVRKYARSLSL